MARKQVTKLSHTERLTVLETQLPALQMSMDAGFSRLGADIGKANATLERLVQADEHRIGAEQYRRALTKHREVDVNGYAVLTAITSTTVSFANTETSPGANGTVQAAFPYDNNTFQAIPNPWLVHLRLFHLRLR